MNWEEEAQKITNRLQDFKNDTDGWKEAKKSKDVTVYWKSSPDFDGALYRTEVVLNADPETVFSYVDPQPDGKRVKWDKIIKDLEIVERIGKELFVLRTVTHAGAGGLISPRDFVDLVATIRTPECHATNARFVEHPSCPPIPKFVRGKNYACGIFCYSIPGEPHKTKVVNYIQSELGGMLPRSLVESALPSNQCDFFNSLRKILKEEGKWVD